jgi:GPI ethanolamine phosphate transferase membrane region
MAVLGGSVIQMSNLVRLSRPDVFVWEYVNDCSADDEIGCSWTRCRESWNSNKNIDEIVEHCSLVLFQKVVLTQFLLASQSLLSSASTDYSVSYMYIGLVTLLLSVAILGVHSTAPVIVKYEFIVVTLSFGTIMFASSYVEEEHQFWYWATTTHFALAIIRRYTLQSSNIVSEQNPIIPVQTYCSSNSRSCVSSDVGIKLAKNSLEHPIL